MKDFLKDVQEYLIDNIPLSQFMQIEIVRCDENQSYLKAPLGPNKNDKGVAFGGSMAVMAKLAAWSKFYEYTQRRGLEGDLLIGKAESKFLKPGYGDLEAFCDSPPQEDWDRFEQFLGKKGRARIVLHSRVVSEGITVMEMTSSFAAVQGFKRGTI